MICLIFVYKQIQILVFKFRKVNENERSRSLSDLTAHCLSTKHLDGSVHIYYKDMKIKEVTKCDIFIVALHLCPPIVDFGADWNYSCGMERKVKELGNGSLVATEDQIKIVVKESLPELLKELGISVSTDTTLIERIVRVEEGLKALRDHVDIRFEETKHQIEESKNHTTFRFEKIKQQIEETRQQIKGSNRYVAFATGLATALVLLAITLSRVL